MVLFIINLHAKEEKSVVDTTDTLYATSVNYLGQCPPAPSVYGLGSSPVHKLLGNFLATSGFFRNFQLVEQLSVDWATLKFLCLDSHSHAHATSEPIKKVKNIAYVENTFAQYVSLLLGSTCFYEKVPLRNRKL